MFHRRRSVFVFVCSIVSIQALYYIVTLQTKKIPQDVRSTSLKIVSVATQKQSGGIHLSSVERPPVIIRGTSNLTEPNSTVGLESTRTSQNVTSNSSNVDISLNHTNITSTANAVTVNITIMSNVTTTTINTVITSNTTTTTVTTQTTTTTILTTAIPFSNASFVVSFNFTKRDREKYNSLPLCNFSISNNDSSAYRVAINQSLFPYSIIEEHQGLHLLPGGHHVPENCRSEQRVAIIVCYRNREQHLKLFLYNIHPFLQKQNLDYTIFVVNQNGADQFNRAALFNVGYLEAMKIYDYDCFIFHDVDLIPEDLRNVYKCGDQPRHMSVAVDKFNYKLLYSTLFGGVTAFSLSDFVGANGYPTVYWGWGGEDDDMYFRVVKKLKKSITRYPMEIARYKMIRTHDHTSGKANPHRHTLLYSKYNYDHDGINSTTYELHNIVFYKLFTLINVTLKEESFDNIRTRLHITKKP